MSNTAEKRLNFENILSISRWKTYTDLSLSCKLNRTADCLYKLNIIYSKELYVVIGGLEVALRNQFHKKISKKYSDKWFDEITLGDIHKNQLHEAKKKSLKKKGNNYKVGDVISELSFGFWVHMLDRPYEQTLWNNCLNKAFPYHSGRPNRKKIRNILADILDLRNKIAHLEPVIRNEKKLINQYKNIYLSLSWICPETAKWFDDISEFKKTYNLVHGTSY